MSNVVVGMRIEVRASLPLVSRTLDDVVQVRNHAGRAKCLAVVVEIDAPRIAGSFGENFELVPRGMVSPDGRVERNAVAVGRARLAHARVREHAVATVEPAVGPPNERVERFVRVLPGPAIEQNLRLAVRNVVAVLDPE